MDAVEFDVEDRRSLLSGLTELWTVVVLVPRPVSVPFAACKTSGSYFCFRRLEPFLGEHHGIV